MLNILVTGTSGFVGQNLLPILHQNGHKIYCFKREGGKCAQGCSVIDEAFLMETSEKFDAIIHLAGLAHVSNRNAKKKQLNFYKSNTDLTEKLVEFAKANHIKTFINLSSIAVLTSASNTSIINDETKPNPVSDYAKSKYAAERHVQSLSNENILAISLRAPLIIGANAKGNWPLLIKLASTSIPLPFNAINNERSFIGIDDLSARILCLLKNKWPVTKSGTYCVAGSPAISLPDIIVEIRSSLGKPKRLFPMPNIFWLVLQRAPVVSSILEKIIGNLVIDDSKFRSTFKYENQYKIKDEIRQSVTG